MQVEEIEINGFQIENFNQHGLDVGKSQGTCPLCSSSRKPENRKAKCASYDWERGLGTCHNCDSTFQMHTYKRKGKAERDYVVPNFAEATTPVRGKTLEWFKTRIIFLTTINDENFLAFSSFSLLNLLNNVIRNFLSKFLCHIQPQ